MKALPNQAGTHSGRKVPTQPRFWNRRVDRDHQHRKRDHHRRQRDAEQEFAARPAHAREAIGDQRVRADGSGHDQGADQQRVAPIDQERDVAELVASGRQRRRSSCATSTFEGIQTISVLIVSSIGFIEVSSIQISGKMKITDSAISARCSSQAFFCRFGSRCFGFQGGNSHRCFLS